MASALNVAIILAVIWSSVEISPDQVADMLFPILSLDFCLNNKIHFSLPNVNERKF